MSTRPMQAHTRANAKTATNNRPQPTDRRRRRFHNLQGGRQKTRARQTGWTPPDCNDGVCHARSDRSGLHCVIERHNARATQKNVVRAILRHASAFDRQNAVGDTYGHQPMGDDEDGSTFDDLAHIVLDDPLAFIIQCARRLVEDEDAWIGDKRSCDCNSPTLAADSVLPRSPIIVS